MPDSQRRKISNGSRRSPDTTERRRLCSLNGNGRNVSSSICSSETSGCQSCPKRSSSKFVLAFQRERGTMSEAIYLLDKDGELVQLTKVAYDSNWFYRSCWPSTQRCYRVSKSTQNRPASGSSLPGRLAYPVKRKEAIDGLLTTSLLIRKASPLLLRLSGVPTLGFAERWWVKCWTMQRTWFRIGQ